MAGAKRGLPGDCVHLKLLHVSQIDRQCAIFAADTYKNVLLEPSYGIAAATSTCVVVVHTIVPRMRIRLADVLEGYTHQARTM